MDYLGKASQLKTMHSTWQWHAFSYMENVLFYFDHKNIVLENLVDVYQTIYI